MRNQLLLADTEFSIEFKWPYTSQAPAISLVLHSRGATCGIQEALIALEKGVNEEVKAKKEAMDEMKR
jgi:hypothetical protein